MDCLDKLIVDQEDTWIDSLPRYQRNRINQLLASGISEIEAASIWLSASPQNVVPFGAERGKNIFLEKLQDEFEAFLCGDKKYDEDRKKLIAQLDVPKGYVIGLISTAIAPVVGSTGVFIAPVIALLLVGIGRMTINAWCQTRKIKKREQQNE